MVDRHRSRAHAAAVAARRGMTALASAALLAGGVLLPAGAAHAEGDPAGCTRVDKGDRPEDGQTITCTNLALGPDEVLKGSPGPDTIIINGTGETDIPVLDADGNPVKDEDGEVETKEVSALRGTVDAGEGDNVVQLYGFSHGARFTAGHGRNHFKIFNAAEEDAATYDLGDGDSRLDILQVTAQDKVIGGAGRDDITVLAGCAGTITGGSGGGTITSRPGDTTRAQAEAVAGRKLPGAAHVGYLAGNSGTIDAGPGSYTIDLAGKAKAGNTGTVRAAAGRHTIKVAGAGGALKEGLPGNAGTVEAGDSDVTVIGGTGGSPTNDNPGVGTGGAGNADGATISGGRTVTVTGGQGGEPRGFGGVGNAGGTGNAGTITNAAAVEAIGGRGNDGERGIDTTGAVGGDGGTANTGKIDATGDIVLTGGHGGAGGNGYARVAQGRGGEHGGNGGTANTGTAGTTNGTITATGGAGGDGGRGGNSQISKDNKQDFAGDGGAGGKGGTGNGGPGPGGGLTAPQVPVVTGGSGGNGGSGGKGSGVIAGNNGKPGANGDVGAPGTPGATLDS